MQIWSHTLNLHKIQSRNRNWQSQKAPPQKKHLHINFPFSDFVNASPTRNSLTYKPQRERDILKTFRKVMGALFYSFLTVSPKQK